MTNPLKGEINLTLGDQEYKTRLTVDSLMQIETATGMGIIKLAQRMSDGDIRVQDIIQVLLYALRGGGNDFDIKKVGSIVGDVGIVGSTQAVAKLLTATLIDSDEEDKGVSEKKE